MSEYQAGHDAGTGRPFQSPGVRRTSAARRARDYAATGDVEAFHAMIADLESRHEYAAVRLATQAWREVVAGG